MALCPGRPGWAGSRKVKPIWILLKQETVSGSGISWAICKSAPRSRQIWHWNGLLCADVPLRNCSLSLQTDNHTSSPPLYRPDALPATQPTASKHWRHNSLQLQCINSSLTCQCNNFLSDATVKRIKDKDPLSLIKDVWWSRWVWVGGWMFLLVLAHLVVLYVCDATVRFGSLYKST